MTAIIQHIHRECHPLGRAPGDSGARERRRSRGNEWSPLIAGDPRPVPAAPLAAARARAAASPRPGRPQPTVPSAGVTHSRRNASSPCSRAAPAPTANPPRLRRSAPPQRRRYRPPSLGARPSGGGRAGASSASLGTPRGPRLAPGAPSPRPGCLRQSATPQLRAKAQC